MVDSIHCKVACESFLRRGTGDDQTVKVQECSLGLERLPGAESWQAVSASQDSGVVQSLGEAVPTMDCAPDPQRDFDRFFNLLPDLACIVAKDGYFKKLNKAWETSLGHSLEELMKVPMASLIHPDDLQRTLDEVARQGPHHRTENFVNRYRCKDGSYRIFEWKTTLYRDESTRFGVARDITRHLQAEREAEAMALKIAHAAEYDPLTDLPNRSLLAKRLKETIDVAKTEGGRFAVLFIDLDGFKHINDSLGHLTGDKLLQSVARRLVECVGEQNTISRHGGDEFVVLLTQCQTREATRAIVGNLLRCVAEPHFIGRHDLNLTASIGVSVWPDDGSDAETLIKNADTAMYEAKENGRRNCQFFEPAMNTKAVERQFIEESLTRALERGEFEIHYQPKVDVRSGTILGAEALLRWTHPVRGDIPLADFIPVAEDCGLIVPIGKWVLRESCWQAQSWIVSGLPMTSLSVNISALELRQENFLENVLETLESTGLHPSVLELDLTETVLMKNAEAAATVLSALRAEGVRLAIDDFGTGYSSLSYLRKFPVNALKIDPSFVRKVTSASAERAIVTAVIDMAHSLQLRVIAEGVETAEELAFLQKQRCDQAQGHFFGRAVKKESFADYFRQT